MQQSNKSTLAIVLAFSCILHAAYAVPQFVTFKDGNVGVNFGGYHAQAGLGGLLTGNAAHGGLSASAGIPGGPQAAAGLGGSVDGRASGNAYAGAQVNPSLGASAVLGGSAGEQGFAGAESHAPGKTTTHTISGVAMEPSAVEHQHQQNDDNMNNSVQKIKPLKRKHTLFKNQAPISTEETTSMLHVKQIVKSYSHDNNANNIPVVYETHTSATSAPAQAAAQAPAQSAAQPQAQTPVQAQAQAPAPAAPIPPAVAHKKTTVQYNGSDAVFHALNIPIGILRSLQESLGGFRLDKTVTHNVKS